MKIGPRARHCIRHFEALHREAYRCPAGVWTIGWGNTRYPDGAPVREGDIINEAMAERLFEAVLAEKAAAVAARVPAASPAQFGAMVSLAWNIGPGNFARSRVLAMHKAGNFAEARAAFASWRSAKGRVLPGLVRRRRAEAALYAGDFATFDRITGYRP